MCYTCSKWTTFHSDFLRKTLISLLHHTTHTYQYTTPRIYIQPIYTTYIQHIYNIYTIVSYIVHIYITHITPALYNFRDISTPSLNLATFTLEQCMIVSSHVIDMFNPTPIVILIVILETQVPIEL